VVLSGIRIVLIRGTDSDDIKNVDLTKVHNLSGPIAVEGAEPGDCLVVDILDVAPFEKMPWGYTVRMPRGLYCQTG
jgi:acetamidase/formamidase